MHTNIFKFALKIWYIVWAILGSTKHEFWFASEYKSILRLNVSILDYIRYWDSARSHNKYNNTEWYFIIFLERLFHYKPKKMLWKSTSTLSHLSILPQSMSNHTILNRGISLPTIRRRTRVHTNINRMCVL